MQTCPGCQYRVDGIFIWNDASWDVQAIYPESTTGEGSYKCVLFQAASCICQLLQHQASELCISVHHQTQELVCTPQEDRTYRDLSPA